MRTKDILRNKYVLYFVLFLAISNAVGYLAVENYDALAIFVIVGFISSRFNKNMIINLGIAIIVTNLLYGGRMMYRRRREGMENKEKEQKESKQENEDEDENKTDSEKQQVKQSQSNDKKKENTKQGFQQKNVPSSKPAPASEEMEDEEIGKRIDYASTLENAYDNLQNLLGKDGMNGLTKETQQLISQQKSLMNTMENMGPMLKMAKETMQGFDMKGIKDTLGQVTGMVNSMKGSK